MIEGTYRGDAWHVIRACIVGWILITAVVFFLGFIPLWLAGEPDIAIKTQRQAMVYGGLVFASTAVWLTPLALLLRAAGKAKESSGE